MTGWVRARCSLGNCAEVAFDGDSVWLRSSLDPDGLLRLTRGEWEAFAAGVKAGEFDRGAESPGDSSGVAAHAGHPARPPTTPPGASNDTRVTPGAA
jgi:hypothetical protein